MAKWKQLVPTVRSWISSPRSLRTSDCTVSAPSSSTPTMAQSLTMRQRSSLRQRMVATLRPSLTWPKSGNRLALQSLLGAAALWAPRLSKLCPLLSRVPTRCPLRRLSRNLRAPKGRQALVPLTEGLSGFRNIQNLTNQTIHRKIHGF